MTSHVKSRTKGPTTRICYGHHPSQSYPTSPMPAENPYCAPQSCEECNDPTPDYACDGGLSGLSYSSGTTLRHLKRFRKETEMILFPEENHSLPRASSPKYLKEYHQHMLQWFDKFNENRNMRSAIHEAREDHQTLD